MSTHKCTIYGLYGAGSRVTVEIQEETPAIEPETVTAPTKAIADKQVYTRNKNIKPTNGLKLALR